jgi:hypothetical protein
LAGKADVDNEPAVDRECQDANAGKHRFKIAQPNQLLRTFQKKSLHAHGIAVAGNVENAAIARSGRFQFPSPKWPPDPPTPDFLDRPPDESGRGRAHGASNNSVTAGTRFTRHPHGLA